MADFTHLHLHTQYSFLDGAIPMGDLCSTIAKQGMNACAVTDHGNMFGAIDFYQRAKKAGIKPILGCEVWLAEADRHDASKAKNHHLLLLAKNKAGFRNLTYLVSMGYLDGYVGRPRIDKQLLKERSEGLIALSGCLGGEVAKNCLEGDLDSARAALREYQAIFSPGHFFAELQDHEKPEQARANACLKQLAEDESLPLVATNNCHYIGRDDAAAHDVLVSIQHGKARNDPTRVRPGTDRMYIRSADEMAAVFADCPEAIANTARIRDMIDLELELNRPVLPTFRPADGSDLETHLRERTRRGLERRFREMPYRVDRDEYLARLETELDIIVAMKFPGYFLIVADFINWAKEHQIPVGPGRGSGAGSLVAYALRITDLDPLPYSLLFERFLNPERVSMPDFDVDFCQERRGEVIQYVSQKYGEHNVGQIATFAQLKAKSVIKDVARALEIPFNDINELTKLLPNVYKDEKGNVKPITIEKALEIEPRLRLLSEENETYDEVIQIARRLEGLYRQAGMHAAGIVIADSPLWEVVPVFRGKDQELVSQYSMADVEAAGLVKFDFLGLKTLDVIDLAERHVNRRIQDDIARRDARALLQHPHLARQFGGDRARLSGLLERNEVFCLGCSLDQVPEGETRVDLTLRCALQPLEDPKVYKLISSGETIGVFQLESTGFQELLKRLKPDCFEDVVAAVALYRPGPLQTGMVDDFIDCKHGRKEVRYPHALLEGTLKPTYGGFVYQEQVMQAAQVMAGYSLGGADLLRRAMGKKKAEVMAAERSKFVDGCVAQGISQREAGEVFDLMEKFAGYGFNKSHSAAYALVTFQTAYLKAYYPVEFMAALLTTEAGSTDNIVKYIAESKSMTIQVLPPTVNDSEISFAVDAQRIRFGLGAIKGLGEAALASILEARGEKPFASLYDFCERVPPKTLNKKALETLVRSGAFDCFEKPRSWLFDGLDRAIDAARGTQRDRISGQGTLFGGGLAEAIKPREIYDEEKPEWPERERLRYEKDAIGFYVTGHPLDRYADEVRRLSSGSIAQLDRLKSGSEATLAVTISAIRERPLKDGTGRMAFVMIEDRSGVTEVMVSAREFTEVEKVLKSDAPVLMRVHLRIDRDGETQTLRLRCLGAQSLEALRTQNTREIELCLDEAQVRPARLEVLRQLFAEHAGSCRVGVRVRIPETAEVLLQLPEQFRLTASDALVDQVEALFGRGAVRFG